MLGWDGQPDAPAGCASWHVQRAVHSLGCRIWLLEARAARVAAGGRLVPPALHIATLPAPIPAEAPAQQPCWFAGTEELTSPTPRASAAFWLGCTGSRAVEVRLTCIRRVGCWRLVGRDTNQHAFAVRGLKQGMPAPMLQSSPRRGQGRAGSFGVSWSPVVWEASAAAGVAQPTHHGELGLQVLIRNVRCVHAYSTTRG